MKGYPALYFPENNRFEPLAPFLDRPCVVGRNPSANVILPDRACAGEQFAVIASAEGYRAAPLSSSTPTFRNGQPLSGPVTLRHDDRLQCGSTTVVYLERESDEFSPAEGTVVIGAAVDDSVGIRLQASEIPLQHDCLLGRAPGRDGIRLEHPRVSRVHAEIRMSGSKTFIRDLGSSNGTFLNGERIAGSRELHVQDRIDIDPYSLRFTGHSLLVTLREGKLGVIARNLTTMVRDYSNGEMKNIMEDVSIAIRPGEFVCILGASGSGKSTLMKALSARASADRNTILRGAVYLNELSLYANFDSLRQSMALVPQKDLLYEDLPLRECIRYAARLRLPADSSEGDIRIAVDRALDRVGLRDLAATPIRHLSGGQKKRAALANETVSSPDLLFLDEVTSGLDEGTDWEMMDLFRRLARHHDMTIVCVTHTVANVDLCDKIVVMTPTATGKGGRKRGPGMLAYFGPPAAARRWFGVDKPGDIYRKLRPGEGREWHDRYYASEEYRRYIGEPLTTAHYDHTGENRPATKPRPRRNKAAEAVRQFRILTSRYFRLVSGDWRTLATAAAQSALIGSFLSMVFGRTVALPETRKSLLFFLGISCFWCGCNNAAKELVKEREIYRLERDVNLSLTSYMASKIVVLAILGVLQVSLLFAIVQVFGTVPGDAPRDFLAMCVSVVAGTSTGLFLSAIAETVDQASTLVPIALIPQILLSGVVVPVLKPMPKHFAQVAISGYWVSGSMDALFDPAGHPAPARAMTVLAAHAVFFTAAAWTAMRRRDMRK